MKIFLALILISIPIASVNAQKNKVAITFDDLPVSSRSDDLKNRQDITTTLIGKLRDSKIPAIGFVNESQLFIDTQRDENQIDLLRQWLESGFELGNHTFSHADLNKMSLEEYEQDILHGEVITKGLLQTLGRKIQYFRHPFLETGQNLKTKRGLEKFLAMNGYTIAPVTMEASDWVFSDAYDTAWAKNDSALMKTIGGEYLKFTGKMINYYTKESKKILRRSIRQIFLVHANRINSVYFDQIIRLFKRRNYRFVPIKTALKDPIYQQKENYIGKEGISWIERWAITQNSAKLLDDEPEVPKRIIQLSH